MDKAAKTALARRVGHMGYEQVRLLMDETWKRRDARRGCPDCKRITGENWHYCDERKAIVAANKGRITQQVLVELRVHTEGCKECHVESHWKEFDSYCEACEELSDRFYIYSNRIHHLETKALQQRFYEAHGRRHASVLELVEWDDAQRVAESDRELEEVIDLHIAQSGLVGEQAEALRGHLRLYYQHPERYARMPDANSVLHATPQPLPYVEE